MTSMKNPALSLPGSNTCYQKTLLIAACMILSFPASGQVCERVKGAKLVAQDKQHTYLGKISHAYDSESIFNEYGNYGSEYYLSSIWNSYGDFGSKYSQYSVNNDYATTPPMIIKNGEIIGYLSINKYMRGAVAANLLKALCKDEL